MVEKVKDRMVSIAGGWESTSWCDLLLWVMVGAKVELVLWCGGWFHSHGTCSTGVLLCMGLGRDRGHDLMRCPFGCMGGSLIEGPWVSSLRRWSEILLPVL
jgi:hypothetical protein